MNISSELVMGLITQTESTFSKCSKLESCSANEDGYLVYRKDMLQIRTFTTVCIYTPNKSIGISTITVININPN